MILLVLRLLIAPILVLGVTLVQRRFGESIGGLVVGLPLSTLPLLWIVALQHGAPFAARMSATILSAGAAQVVVIWFYARIAGGRGPVRTVLMTLAVFVAITAPLIVVHESMLIAAAMTVGAFVVAVQQWPRDVTIAVVGGRHRLGLRMVVATLVTLVIASSAGIVGPALAGLLGSLPVMSLTIGVMTQRELGAGASTKFLQGVNRGTLSYVASILALTVVLRMSGDVALSFSTAIVIALATQLLTHAATTSARSTALMGVACRRSTRLFVVMASTPHLLAAPHGIAARSTSSRI